MRGLSAALAAAVLSSVLPGGVAAADSKPGPKLPAVKQPKAVPVTPVRTGSVKKPDAAAQNPWKAPKISWPAAGTAEVDLTSGPASKAFLTAPTAAPAIDANAQKAGKLPVSVSTAPGKAAQAPAKAKVTLATKDAARKAGIDGILLSVGRSDGSNQPAAAKVEVDYNAFRSAYGGDYAARLHLVELPACALTTPDLAECRTQKPLETRNDTRSGKLSTQLTTLDGANPTAKSGGVSAMAAPAAAGGATVLAATAGDAGPTGDYKATSLQPAGAWTSGGSTGAFAWSYGISTPPVPGGLAPNIALGYSSQSVDGRTSASSGQSSWIGDGWNWEPGFIERKYKPCNDDKTGGTNTTKVGDQCWFNDNATMSLGGKSTELVFEQGKGWHPAADSGEKVEKLTGASNGDNDGEHWKITTTDGTQYFFGLNRLPGWKDNGSAADDPTTKSTWTAPVFGNQAGEPCYNASFASAWCKQAWRWQLDYVVAPGGTAMAYYWNTETNNYARNLSETTGKGTVTPYIRGGWLDRIDYGLRSDAVYTGKAAAQVKFDVAERCLTNCGTFDETNAKNWPDTPFDLFCKDGSAECKGQYSPTFWSRMRLTEISTKVLTAGAYQDVDSWKLDQGFPPAGDGISTPMWLKSITRTAKAGDAPDITMPPVTFAGQQMANRVDKTGDGIAPFIRLRMHQVITETGGSIGVIYSTPDCTSTTLPAADATNTTRCYPVKWAAEGETSRLDWFNTYVATQIAEDDNVASTPDRVTSYSYLGGAAWDMDTSEFTKAADRVHSISRGYGLVQTRTGSGQDAQTLSETRYFRGLDGKEVKDGTGSAVTDRPEFSGLVRESATYNGDDTSKLVSAVSNTPWRSEAAAKRGRPGLPDLVSYKTGTEKTSTRTTVTSGTRTTETSRHFDEYGMVDWESNNGDTAKTGDESCTTTTYARNTTSWILNKHSRVESVAVPCGTAANRPADVLGDTRTYFDNGPLGTVPAAGLITKTEKINGKGDGYDIVAAVPSTCGPAQNQTCYDVHGRALASTDAYGKVTTTTYTPAAGEPATTTVVTNPKGHIVTTETDPLRAQLTKATDANGKVTTTAYDAMGRVTKVWLPTRAAATYPDVPNRAFEYLIRNNGPGVITSKTLTHDGKYSVSHSIQDGLGRELQTQTQSPDLAGRLITQTSYDSRGLAWRNSGTYYATGAPSPDLVTGQELNYPASTDTVFDGAGRPTAVISKKFGTETKRTTTNYTGDTTTVIPPQGGTATTTVVDALGRTTELKQYTNAARTTSQSTTYGYNKLGQLAEVTDPGQAKWTYTYDVRGRQTEANDPDKGKTKTVYDQGDRVTDVTDARNVTLHTDYDELGRPLATKNGTTTLTSMVYDTVAKGQLTTSTRFVDGKAYESTVTAYNSLYQPVANQVTIPSTPDTGAMAGTYKWNTSYNLNTGQAMWVRHPAMGDQPTETVSNTYLSVSGLRNTMIAGGQPLISAMTYDHYGRPMREELGDFGQHLWQSNQYDEHTGAVTRATIDREVAPKTIQDTKYTTDPAGNLTFIATAYGQDTQRTTDTQCVNLDALRRITQAWTNKGETCAASPSTAVIGGEDPYWSTFTYDAVGNRKTDTKHKTASGPTADTTRTYAAPTAGKHDLTKVTQTGTDPHDETFTYDAAGNTKTRKSGTGETQYLDWDAEGHLKSLIQGTSTSTYLYDAAGTRLLRKEQDATTLYLPGGNELKLDKSGTVTATRYYGDIAVRTGGKLTFTLTDHHNTGTIQVTADAAQTVTRRKTGLFGENRGTQPTDWAGEKGFVGGTKDSGSGLTHIGAREYDPTIGRFVSVDPIMDLADAQQLHGYTYANNNPVSFWDPSGLWLDDGWGRSEKRDGSGPGYGRNSQGHYPDTTPTVHDTKSINNTVNHVERKITKIARTYMNDKTYVAFRKAYEKELSAFKARIGYITEDDRIAVAANVCLGPGSVHCPEEAKNEYFSMDMYRITQYVGYEGTPGAGAGGAGGASRGGARGGAAAGKSCKCFLAGTGVLMADGATKKIEDVKVGDEVIATDPRSGDTGKRRVSKLIVTEDDKNFNRLSIVTPDGVEQLVATHEHPFWSPSEGDWIEAGDLRQGMSFLTASSETVILVGNEAYTQRARTYNLTVEDLHTYYVLAGATPVLVHNSAGDCGISARYEKAGDIGRYADGQDTRDPASQWYHEMLSNEELLDGINNPGAGDGILVSSDGTILGGHHRKDELRTRMRDGRIDPDTPIRIDVYDGE
ncbi:polymorphic toxin-type HINT domain-containing protein [Streptomyces sp. NPDC058674]|uniref:polymorphic toxin-type HINT domain-containing protein n=1 Tax=Streptomyces sp. NPDC058674 TaxID=3346592 RepID=UPI003660122F